MTLLVEMLASIGRNFTQTWITRSTLLSTMFRCCAALACFVRNKSEAQKCGYSQQQEQCCALSSERQSSPVSTVTGNFAFPREMALLVSIATVHVVCYSVSSILSEATVTAQSETQAKHRLLPLVHNVHMKLNERIADIK